MSVRRTSSRHVRGGGEYRATSQVRVGFQRSFGSLPDLRNAAIANAQALGTGHVFVLILRDAYPINLLNVVQNIPEVCSIVCATANPVEVIVARTEQGRGVMGVIDGSSPKGIESPAEINARKEFLRKIGYKR